MRLRRKRPASSVEPDRFEAAAEVLERWATRGSAQSMLYTYKREARQRQKAQAGARAHTKPDRRSPVFLQTPAAPTPQAPAQDLEPVPSEPSAEGPAKTSEQWAYEHFRAFETLCGNGDRIAERIEEARSYEPEEALPEYLW